MRYILSMIALLTMVIASSATAPVIKQFSIHFNSDEHTLDPEDRLVLQEVMKYINSCKYAEVELYANTDNDASDNYNILLSQRRASSVKAFFTGNQALEKRIRVAANGESKPVAENKTEEGKAKNRRVDIIVKSYAISSATDALKAANPVKVESFSINANINNNIVGKQGTVLYVPAGSIIQDNGTPVYGMINLQLKEYYSPADIIASKVSTLCDGKILETGGMFDVSASQNGKQLKVKRGTSIYAAIPTRTPKQDMKLFTASTNSDGVTVWQNTNASFTTAQQRETLLNIETLTKMLLPNTEYTTTVSFEYKLPILGTRPTHPGRAPKLVKSKNRSLKTLFKSIYTKKEKRMKELQRKDAREKKTFETRLKNYNKRLAKYEADLKKYLEDSAAFEKEYSESFQAWVSSNRIAHQERINNIPIEHWNRAITFLLNNSTNTESLKELKLFFSSHLNIPNGIVQEVIQYCIADAILSAYENKSMAEVVRLNKFRPILKLNPNNPNSELRRLAVNINKPKSIIQEQLKKYPELFEILNDELARMYKYEASRIALQSSGVAAAYQTALSSFGMFNCDRFSTTPENQLVSVEIPYDEAALVSFYIPELKAYIYPYQDKLKYHAKLPKNLTVVVVYVTHDKESGPMMYINKTKFTSRAVIRPTPQFVTIAEMSKSLKSLS